jgi:thiosulfate/3-mercaptopyruvate sulfurtransferase
MIGMAPLTSTAQLADALSAAESMDRPVVLDVRWRLAGPPARADYDAGHIPGAVFLDLDSELAAPPGMGGRHPLPEPAELEVALRRAGITDSSTVVSYDDDDGSAAARAWWLLRWIGLPADRVSVLDGGYRAWVGEGRPVEADAPNPSPGAMTVRPGLMPVLDANSAAGLARTGVLLDARVPERYRGETEPVDPRAGHIPGARNAPAKEHLGPEGRWRSPAELAARFAELGLRAESDVGAYCGSGVAASAVVLALEHAGLRGPERPAALYAGSWSHWCTDPDRPVATGAEPAVR